MSMSRKLIMFLLTTALFVFSAVSARAQTGIFDRTGIIPGHGTYSSLPEETVDLFTGNLTLRYRDIFIPGRTV